MKTSSVIGFFFLAAAVRIAVTLSAFRLLAFPVQQFDSYVYVLKALEIGKGDWSPIATHGIGWPIFLAPLLRAFGAASLPENFAIGIVITAVMGAAAVFPLAALGKTFLPSSHATAMALIAYTFLFPAIVPESHFLIGSESLFVFFFLFSVFHAHRAVSGNGNAVIAGTLGGLAYWVRPNGIFVLPVIIAVYAIAAANGKKFSWLKAGFIASAFFLAATPFLLQRAAYFGSAFSYAENSKYFMDRYTDVWGSGYENVSLREYVASHGPLQVTERFLVRGFLIVMLYFLYNILPFLHYFLQGVRRTWKEKGWRPLWAAMGIWMAGLVPVFSLFYVTRHLLPVAPLAALVAGAGASRAEGEGRTEQFFFGVSQAVFLALSFLIMVFFMRMLSTDISRYTEDGIIWSRWAATHLKGTVAVGMGSDFIMRALPDARIGGHGMLDMEAPESGITTFYPGKFPEIGDAMPALRARGARYVVLDDRTANPLPLVNEKYLSIYTGNDIPPYFKEVYSNYASQSQWKVRIFEIDWKEYGQYHLDIHADS